MEKYFTRVESVLLPNFWHYSDAKFVKEQYKNSSGLSTRISIHDKYSTNKMGLHNWYFTVMKFEEC